MHRPVRPPPPFDLKALLRDDPEGLVERLALGIAISPRPGTEIAKRYPVLLERPTLGPKGGPGGPRGR